MQAIFFTVLTVFVLLCFLMILLILIQKGRGGGISSAFGGGGGGNTAFGSKTGDVLTWATSIVFAVFLVMAVSLNLLADKVNDEMVGRGPAPTPDAPTEIPMSLPPVETPTTPADSSQVPPISSPTLSTDSAGSEQVVSPESLMIPSSTQPSN